MKYEDYNDPLYLIWNKDTSGNLVSVKVTNETYNVRYGMFVLKGVPDEGYKVLIDNMTEVKDREELGINEFEVDYVYGLVRMNPHINNQEITIKEYWSRGNYYYPAHRIYWTIDELTGKATTIHDVIEYMITYFKNTKKEIVILIEDFRKELKNEWEKLLLKFEELEGLIGKSQVERKELENLLFKAIMIHQDLTNIIKSAQDLGFTGIAEKTKIIVDNAKFPLFIKKEGNELGVIKDGLKIDKIFRYCSMVIKFIANGKVKNPILYNYKTHEFIKINAEMKQGDVISVATSFYKNNASLYTNQNKSYKVIDITDKISTNTSYMYLSVGTNMFIIDADHGKEFLDGNIFYDGRNRDDNYEYNNGVRTENIQSINGKKGRHITLNIEDIKYINGDTIEEKIKKSIIQDKKIRAKNVDLQSDKFKSNNVKDGLEELFTFASNGKELIADAITGKGVNTNKYDSFEQMSDNINKIQTNIIGYKKGDKIDTKDLGLPYEFINTENIIMYARIPQMTGRGHEIYKNPITNYYWINFYSLFNDQNSYVYIYNNNNQKITLQKNEFLNQNYSNVQEYDLLDDENILEIRYRESYDSFRKKHEHYCICKYDKKGTLLWTYELNPFYDLENHIYRYKNSIFISRYPGKYLNIKNGKIETNWVDNEEPPNNFDRYHIYYNTFHYPNIHHYYKDYIIMVFETTIDIFQIINNNVIKKFTIDCKDENYVNRLNLLGINNDEIIINVCCSLIETDNKANRCSIPVNIIKKYNINNGEFVSRKEIINQDRSTFIFSFDNNTYLGITEELKELNNFININVYKDNLQIIK